MTSSADWLGDFLASTLAGTRPELSSGTTAAGVRWTWQNESVLLLEPAGSATHSVFVFAGVHGDETAPIEMLSRLVVDIANGQAPLAVRMLVILGNIDAMRAGHRYIDDDLNRLFSGRHTNVPASHEAPRAAQLEASALRFFAGASHAKWHIGHAGPSSSSWRCCRTPRRRCRARCSTGCTMRTCRRCCCTGKEQYLRALHRACVGRAGMHA